MTRPAKPAASSPAGNPGRRATGTRAARRSFEGRRPLTRERIIAAAQALIDRDGLAAFSIRGLGAALSCEPMSIYHYFPGKAHLQDALLDAALATLPTRPANGDPIERLRQLAFAYRALAHRYPKLYPLIAVHRLNTPTGVKLIDEVLVLVHAAVPDARLAAQFFRVFGYYLTGASLDETAGYANGPSAAEPVTDAYVAENCPRLAAAAPYFESAWWDSTFDLGLDCLLVAMRTASTVDASAPALPNALKPVIRPKQRAGSRKSHSRNTPTR